MFWDRYVQLCNSKGLKPQPAGKLIGIESGTISLWKKNAEEGKLAYPKCDKLVLVADFFNCSTDYLLERTDVKEIGGPANAWLLSKEEMKLVECFRESNERKQMQLLGWASEFAEEAEKGTGETSADRLAR